MFLNNFFVFNVDMILDLVNLLGSWIVNRLRYFIERLSMVFIFVHSNSSILSFRFRSNIKDSYVAGGQRSTPHRNRTCSDSSVYDSERKMCIALAYMDNIKDSIT